ncbi:ATPase family AAA domain-containing protein 2-like [Pollicipes pollicipes]|uniref:ATPase family AAA domain-containing protein 2-like n=1 Tax=Pollicipes pollicipes TaxID=41117 RepID=UPI001884DB06|nr:ATPase family AAA domain-containing protein 2-like [Pollicipes pollicipes]
MCEQCKAVQAASVGCLSPMAWSMSAGTVKAIFMDRVSRTRDCQPLPLYAEAWQEEREMKYTGMRRSGRKRKMMYDNFSDTWITTQIAHSGRQQEGMDMYSRVKRTHRPAQRFGMPAEEPPPARVRRFVSADSSSGDPRTETKVIKKYYLRENRREPEFYQDDSLQLPASPRRELRDERYPHRWRRRHRRHKNAAFNESTTDSSSGRDSGEENFERRKARSMQGFRNKCLPLNFTKADASQRAVGERQRVGTSLADVDPMAVDKDVNFDMIGGLRDHIRDLKEMILLPLLYPEVFSSKNITPPKGVLFCGPPGTGKTLMARALSNECGLGDRKVAFFMRKGADVLSKWVGESERQLRLLFDQAYQMRPSIIFFDEVDGLAPVRSSKQDYIHASIVSTLLALMDGVDSRGEVIVIGATNRPDSIDPALRRPGRFDREFYFPLPPLETAGYCGADLKHLVTEAVLHALRERYPQIYRSKQRLLIDVESIQQAELSRWEAYMPRLLLAGRPGQCHSEYLAPALLHGLENVRVFTFNAFALHATGADAARGQVQIVADPGVEERRKLFTRLFMKTAILLKKRKSRTEVLAIIGVSPECPVAVPRVPAFELFRQPVEEEDAPDYYSIIERPMDLDTIMTRIDQHKYEAAEDFLADVDQICTNALEYNPDTTEIGREIRHRACMLRDQVTVTAHKLIAEQLDSDFEEECKLIRQSRRERAESPTKFAPSYLVTPRLYQQQNGAPRTTD